MAEQRKVEFDRLEDRVLPSGAGMVISSESISRLLAELGDSSVLAIGSYDAFPGSPGLTTAGAVVAGAGIAAYGLKRLREQQQKREADDTTTSPSDRDSQDGPET